MQVTILIILATWVVGSFAFFGLLGLVNRDARLPQQLARFTKHSNRAADGFTIRVRERASRSSRRLRRSTP